MTFKSPAKDLVQITTSIYVLYQIPNHAFGTRYNPGSVSYYQLPAVPGTPRMIQVSIEILYSEYSVMNLCGTHDRVNVEHSWKNLRSWWCTLVCSWRTLGAYRSYVVVLHDY